MQAVQWSWPPPYGHRRESFGALRQGVAQELRFGTTGNLQPLALGPELTAEALHGFHRVRGALHVAEQGELLVSQPAYGLLRIHHCGGFRLQLQYDIS